MFTIFTLLFLVARRASRIHIVFYYFSSIVELLLKLSTMYKSLLHGPCNYTSIERGDDRPIVFYHYIEVFETSKIRFESWERKCKYENSGAYVRVLKQRMKGRQRAKKKAIVQLYYCSVCDN